MHDSGLLDPLPPGHGPLAFVVPLTSEDGGPYPTFVWQSSRPAGRATPALLVGVGVDEERALMKFEVPAGPHPQLQLAARARLRHAVRLRRGLHASARTTLHAACRLRRSSASRWPAPRCSGPRRRPDHRKRYFGVADL